MSIRVIVCGSRNYSDFDESFKVLLRLFGQVLPDVEIVSGTCRGGDMCGEHFASVCGLPVSRFPADWNRFGKSAGPRRNEQMLQYALQANAFVVAFWDGASKGTRNMVQIARQAGVPVCVVKPGSYPISPIWS